MDNTYEALWLAQGQHPGTDVGGPAHASCGAVGYLLLLSRSQAALTEPGHLHLSLGTPFPQAQAPCMPGPVQGANCYGPNVHVPSYSDVEALGDGVGRRDLWEVIRPGG